MKNYGWRLVTHYRRAVTKIVSEKNKRQEGNNVVVRRSLPNSWEKKRSEKQRRKGKYTQRNAEFQRIGRRDKEAFLSEQRKETEENNRLGKTRRSPPLWVLQVAALSSHFSALGPKRRPHINTFILTLLHSAFKTKQKNLSFPLSSPNCGREAGLPVLFRATAGSECAQIGFAKSGEFRLSVLVAVLGHEKCQVWRPQALPHLSRRRRSRWSPAAPARRPRRRAMRG